MFLAHLRVCTRWSSNLLGAIALSCTFYTDCPNAGEANQPGPGPTGGSGGGGGTSGQGATGGDAGASGEAGAGSTEPDGVWINATGNLAGRNTACGNAQYLSVKPDGLLILAVAQDGLWTSSDRGDSWSALGTGNRSELIGNRGTGIVYDPDHAGTFWEVGIYGPGVYKTTDDGETFTNLGDIQHNDYLSVDFSDPDRRLMLAGAHEQAQTLYRTEDAGETWEQIGQAITEPCDRSSYPVILDPDTYLLGCQNGILRSEDGGDSWQVVSLFGGELAPLFSSDGAIYWLINGGGLVKSEDEGRTWQRVTGVGVLGGAPPVELPDGSLGAVGDRVILRSTDGGNRWDAITTQATTTSSFSGFVYSIRDEAFFAWRVTCDSRIPEDAVLRYSYRF